MAGRGGGTPRAPGPPPQRQTKGTQTTSSELEGKKSERVSWALQKKKMVGKLIGGTFGGKTEFPEIVRMGGFCGCVGAIGPLGAQKIAMFQFSIRELDSLESGSLRSVGMVGW